MATSEKPKPKTETEITFMNSIINKIMEGEIIKDSRATSYIFTSFIFVGIITHLFFSNIK